MAKITVKDTEVAVIKVNDEDYICITDIARFKTIETYIVICNWMRNRNTIEYLGIWESLNNPGFKPIEFDRFRKEAGLNAFTLSPKKWIESTNAIGLITQSGRYGGTYAINNYNYISSGAPVSRSVGDKFNDFYKCNWGTYDWQTPQNDYSWLLGSSSNPCPAGYYIPTESEWKALSDRSRSSANGRVTLPGDNGLNLIIPQAGYRNCDNQFGGRNSIANYFTSTADPNGNGCYKFTSYSNKWVVDITSRGNAYPLRCIKEQ